MLKQEQMTYNISTPEAMEELGANLSQVCNKRSIVHLDGELGVGKTTLVRGFLHAFGHTGIVKSPTYTLVEPYQLNGHKIYHFDFYRLGDPEELEYLGIRDYLEDNAICLIEWPEQGGQFTPAADIQVSISYHSKTRILKLQAYNSVGRKIIANLVSLQAKTDNSI